MSSSIEWTDIMLGIVSIIVAGALAMFLKSFLYKYRRPNGKKGGIISFHATVGFAIVTVVAMSTKDWFLTGLSAILAYLIARGRLDEGQHYLYQVITSAVIGILVPFGIFYFYYKQTGKSLGGNKSSERTDYEDKPSRAHDDRAEADAAPELRLDNGDGDGDGDDELDFGE